MAEYITKSKLKEYIEKYCNPEGCIRITAEDVYKTALTTIECVPTADVVEVKHGEWLEIIKDIGRGRTLISYQCNQCDVYTAKELNYCPNCGAKMDGRRGSEC